MRAQPGSPTNTPTRPAATGGEPRRAFQRVGEQREFFELNPVVSSNSTHFLSWKLFFSLQLLLFG
jgi:hypothetical protein